MKRLMNGDLVVHVYSPSEAHRLAQIHKLLDLLVTVSASLGLNTKQDIIFSAEAADMTPGETDEMLSHLGIRKVVKKRQDQA